MDPADVYRLRLKKGDKLVVRLIQPKGTKLKLSFGKGRLARRAGSRFGETIRKAGTYFVGVTIQKTPPAGSAYKLSLKR